MKKEYKFRALTLLTVCLTIFFGCKKDVQLPVLDTAAVSQITTISASTGGIITSNGGDEVTARGVCWSTLHNPTVYNSKTKDGKGFGTFSSNLGGLITNTTYYVRAYATNSAGTAYGNEISFTSNSVLLPALTTTAATSITLTGAISGGKITSDGGDPVTARGVCWSTARNPTVADSKTLNGTGSGSFTSIMTGLLANTYFVRAYATNSIGTSYGNEISFTLIPVHQVVLTTNTITVITEVSAVSGGTITNDGGEDIKAKGVCWSTSENPTTSDSKTNDGTGTGIFSSNLAGLNTGTTYFVRAYVTNSEGVFYGNQLIFTTSSEKVTGTQKADFPGGKRYDAAGFAIGKKIYMGLGYDDGDLPKRDFWEWDQASNVWTKLADYPGSSTGGAVSFSIGSKGYIGTGSDFYSNGLSNEFWEYDPSTNTWTKKSSVPGTIARAYAAGFSIGTKGYIGTGYSNDDFYGSYLQDFWEWDQATNVWTKKADFGGTARGYAVGFSIGNKGYIGTGLSNGTSLNDFWEWDQANNVWTQKADIPGMSRLSAIGFSIGNKGYIGSGVNYDTSANFKKDFWEWDQATNIWTQKANFAGSARASAVGFSIGNKGYLGTGSGGNVSYALRDFWEYNP